MARKRHSDEDVLKLLREIEVKLVSGSDVPSACHSVGISDATYYNWRKRFGGMRKSQLSELRSLEKENGPVLGGKDKVTLLGDKMSTDRGGRVGSWLLISR